MLLRALPCDRDNRYPYFVRHIRIFPIQWCRRSGSNRHGSCLPTVFETAASTYSATSASAEAQGRTGDTRIFSPTNPQNKTNLLSNPSTLLIMFLTSRRQRLSPRTLEFYHCYLRHARGRVSLVILQSLELCRPRLPSLNVITSARSVVIMSESEILQHYTRWVTFHDSLKFYKAPLS